jgi:hypothetical protein
MENSPTGWLQMAGSIIKVMLHGLAPPKVLLFLQRHIKSESMGA